jgi:hypothetical protein
MDKSPSITGNVLMRYSPVVRLQPRYFADRLKPTRPTLFEECSLSQKSGTSSRNE